MKLLQSVLIAVATGAVAVAAADEPAALARDLGRVLRTYDADAATEVLSRARIAGGGEARPLLELRVEAGLAVAELLRIEYEETPAGEHEARRILGQRIDAAAEEALGLIDDLPESSERYRMEADLVATMIRSDFRARKYRDRLEAATGRALDLDPGNARAWVTAAKPFVFAEAVHGGDLDEAVRLLDRALELEPGLEPALLLRALAHERRGDDAKSEADWRAALAANPDCEPARRALGGG